MKSIRKTITRSVSLAVLLVCALIFAGAFVFLRSRLVAQFDQSLQTTAETLAGLIELGSRGVQMDERDESLTEFRRPVRPSVFEVRGNADESLLRSPSLKTSLPLTAMSSSPTWLALEDGRRARAIVMPVTPQVEQDDAAPQANADNVSVTLIVARDTGDLDLTIRWIAVALVMALAALAMGMLILIPRLVRRGLQPLVAMSEQAGSIDAQSLTQRFPITDMPSELMPISEQLNASLDRLENAFAREQRFSASAAHELRTPLAAIRSNAEVALKWPDAQQNQLAMRSILASSVRMTSLIERLLELARGQSLSDSIEWKPVVLREQIISAVDRNRILSQERGLTLDVDVSHALRVMTDVRLLDALLDNLVANAIQHSPANSLVRIASTDSGQPELTICNEAPHLSTDDLAHFFEPLWTKSTSRTTDHAGLGLVLAADYARALKITLRPELSSTGRFIMHVVLPDIHPSNITDPTQNQGTR